ncbi:hypothetical protein A6E15_08700 [Natrinema saccharevitans]|uniref:Uncharacterized protein n=1 Tax=Natrinema saccharevitans TaxID=301967 RepID=A0A1S8AWY8_9EURY|nr:hypothetical protein [Natrinema saccharevitans]OLZ41061.1 hypothetical protein A6E15_08700 [Natrinema saccharevitans]
MDQRLIATTPFLVYLALCGLFWLAQSTVEAPLTLGQPAFLATVGLFVPLLAVGLIWIRNYAYGAPLLVSSMVATAWFVTYFFFVHDNPANALAVSGTGATAFLTATIGVVSGAVVTAGVGCWLWYRESPSFRSAVDELRGPSRN